MPVGTLLEGARRRDPYADLIGVQLTPKVRHRQVVAVCSARHDHDGPVVLEVGLEGPTDLGDLAHSVAEHRAQAHAGPWCTCPTFPADGAVRRTDDPGCPEHGRIARAFDAQTDLGVFAGVLAGRLGHDPGRGAPDPQRVIAAAAAALDAARAALTALSARCETHGGTPPAVDEVGLPVCAGCRPPALAREALAALQALAPTDVWDTPREEEGA